MTGDDFSIFRPVSHYDIMFEAAGLKILSSTRIDLVDKLEIEEEDLDEILPMDMQFWVLSRE